MSNNKREEFVKKYKAVKAPHVISVNVGDVENFKKYIDYLKEQNDALIERVKSLKIAKFIGRYDKYIKEELLESLKRLSGTTMMVHYTKKLDAVTDRRIHSKNAANIAYKISEGIFKDEEISKGIALVAELHDIGQPALGHAGENMISKASMKRQGGPRPHNATGSSQILFRHASKIRNAINKGISTEVIEKKSIERRISVEELSQNIKDGKEPEIEKEINDKYKYLEPQIDSAIEIIAMSVGRHNGERGVANIIPEYKIKFADFYRVLEKCFIYEGADKEMKSANMVDAIVKVSDQISSIPYDMIDGKKGGLVIEIPTSYVEPISNILGIKKEEILQMLKGDNRQLNKLVVDIQDKLVEDLVESSSKEMLHLKLGVQLYGKKDEMGKTTVQGLRMPTYAEYLPYTGDEQETKILQEAWYKCTEKLSKQILEESGVFPKQLNAIFRMDENDERRKIYERHLSSHYSGREEYRDFMDYVLKTTPKEYNFIKSNCNEYAVNLIKEKIKIAKREFERESNFMANTEDEIAQGILNYMYSSNKGIPRPENGEEYTDEEINAIYKDINNLRSIQGKKSLLMQRDERIATQLSLGYLETRFNDAEFIEFCVKIGAMKPEDVEIVTKCYDPVIKNYYMSDNLLQATKMYEEAEKDDGLDGI